MYEIIYKYAETTRFVLLVNETEVSIFRYLLLYYMLLLKSKSFFILFRTQMNLTQDTEIIAYSCLNYCTSNKISIKNLCPFIVGRENSNSNLLKILYFLEVSF